jgi:hypothetical protein
LIHDLIAPDRVDGGRDAVGNLQHVGLGALAVLIAGVEALDDAGGRAPIPHRHASHRLHDALILSEARQLARGAGP